MSIQPIYLLYGAIFLGVLLLVEGIYYLIQDSRGGRDRANRRMRVLAAASDPKSALRKFRRSRRPGNTSGFRDPIAWLDDLILQSGVNISVLNLLVIMGAVFGLTFIVVFVMFQEGVLPASLPPIPMSFLAAVGLGGFYPIIYLSSKKSERRKKFSEQLPDALDVMVRSLQAGHPVSASLNLVAQEMSDPIGTEFGLAVDEMTYGKDLRQALENLALRIDAPDFEYVIVAINIQHDTGGNLAEVLAGLASVIRARFRMFKKVRALSAEGRVSGIILSGLPFVTLFVIYSGNPQYYHRAMDDPVFWPVAGMMFGLMLTGIYIMYRMINFKF